MKTESFICPGCKRKTIQPVEQWENDFLAVHEVQSAMIGNVPLKVVTDKCDVTGNKTIQGSLFVMQKPAKKKVEKIEEKGGLF